MKNPKLMVFVDLDLTLADARSAFTELGPEPDYDSNPSVFETWLEKMTESDRLLSFPVCEPIHKIMQNLLKDSSIYVCYLTGRRESLRSVTKQWLQNNKLPNLDLIMRPEKDYSNAGTFKTQYITNQVNVNSCKHVLVIDDDPSGILNTECQKNNWVLAKPNY